MRDPARPKPGGVWFSGPGDILENLFEDLLELLSLLLGEVARSGHANSKVDPKQHPLPRGGVNREVCFHGASFSREPPPGAAKARTERM